MTSAILSSTMYFLSFVDIDGGIGANSRKQTCYFIHEESTGVRFFLMRESLSPRSPVSGKNSHAFLGRPAGARTLRFDAIARSRHFSLARLPVK